MPHTALAICTFSAKKFKWLECEPNFDLPRNRLCKLLFFQVGAAGGGKKKKKFLTKEERLAKKKAKLKAEQRQLSFTPNLAKVSLLSPRVSLNLKHVHCTPTKTSPSGANDVSLWNSALARRHQLPQDVATFSFIHDEFHPSIPFHPRHSF